MASVVISILFNLLGLLGAYKQNSCLTMTYALFMTLTTFGSLITSLEAPDIYWLYLVFNLLITVLAFAYARDLMIIRNQMFTTPILMSPSQPQTIFHLAQQQQYSSPSDGWEPPPDYNSSLSDGWQPPPDYNSEQCKTDKYYRFA